MKQKKDIIFLLVLGLVLANLILLFAKALQAFIVSGNYWWIFWVFTDGIAMIGVLYLLRSYKRARKETKRLEQEQKQEKEEDPNP